MIDQSIIYELRDWVDVDKLDWKLLSSNPRAIQLLEQHPEKINWYWLCCNESPDAILSITQNIDQLDSTDWTALSKNPSAIDLVKQYPHKIDYTGLCSNTHPYAIDLLEQNSDKINWYLISKNPSAIRLLENRTFVDWDGLSTNPNAVHLLKQHTDKISIRYLCRNPNVIDVIKDNPRLIDKIDRLDLVGDNLWYHVNKNARKGLIQFLEQYPEKLNWRGLSENPLAIDILESCDDKTKLDYKLLSLNPEIFTIRS